MCQYVSLFSAPIKKIVYISHARLRVTGMHRDEYVYTERRLISSVAQAAAFALAGDDRAAGVSEKVAVLRAAAK